MLLLGIDVGTSELKAGLFDEAGGCLGLASGEYTVVYSDAGFAELDPEVLWRSVCNAVREVLARGSRAGERVVLAFSVHGESFVGVGDAGTVGSIVLNIDQRAAREMDEFVGAFGAERIYEITGLPPHPMYTLPKILWMRKHQPERFATTQRFFCLEDYLLFRCTGDAVINFALASRTLGFDIESGRWSPQLLRHAGIREEQMARPSAGGLPVGELSNRAAEQMGLPAGTLCVTGGHDQACTSIGAGGLADGTAVDGTGTFECISVTTANRLASPLARRANLPCERHTVPGRFLSLAYTPGGITLKWLRDECGRDLLETAQASGRNPYDLLLAGSAEEPTGLIFLPYLFGTGTPWIDTNARGVIYGITASTTRDALARAALEGVTCEMRWNLEMLERLRVTVQRIVAVGGGTRSRFWLQLKADIFGRPVAAPPGEAACRGAAICAGVGAGTYSNFQSAVASTVKTGTSYEPRIAVHRRYNEMFEQYKKLAGRLYGYKLPVAESQTHA